MLATAREHYNRQTEITAAAVDEFSSLTTSDPRRMAEKLAAYQLLAAREAIAAVPQMLAEQDVHAPLVARPSWTATSGVASDGRPLASLLEQAGSDFALASMVITQVEDAGRGAATISIAARPKIGWVRMVNPGACSRCVVQAGRWFRYNQGFERHPRCRCTHVPAPENAPGDIGTDPKAYFDSLSTEEQDRVFTKAGAEAIRMGADMGQVINARRGMSTAQGELITREGTTRRGRAYQSMTTNRRADIRLPGERYSRTGEIRLMPETILAQARNRREAQELLRYFGYLT